MKPDPRVLDWFQTVDERLIYLSVLTLGEIRKGVAGLTQGKRRTQLETWLEVELQSRFSDRILPIDRGVAERWGLLAASAKSNGTPLPVVDGLLAATAVHYDLTVATRNTGDFAQTLVPCINPWEA